MMQWLTTILQLFFPLNQNFRIGQIYTTSGYHNYQIPRMDNQWVEWIFFAVIFIIATYYVFDVFIIFVKKMIGKKKRKH